ncbi:MAG: hypothetical protein IJ343_04485 [Clostridia bacterium]|nr:hypothetical protein [Clostridia bacterium]
MKKTLCMLLTMLLALTACAALAETDDDSLKGFYLFERRLTQTEEGCVLQLRLFKAGGIQYCLDEPDVLLLDAEGNEIVPLATQMTAPLNPVPAGDQYFTVTLVYTLPEGAEPVSFQVLSIPGELYAEPSAEPLELHNGHILMHTKDGPCATCWLEKPSTEDSHSGHMMVLHVYDADENYLGSQALSWENADCLVPGSSAREKLSEISGFPGELIDYYGIDFNAESEYYFFDRAPLTGLLYDDIPASASAETYRTKSPLTVLASSFEPLADGRWRAYCLLQNGACEPISFNGHSVSLFDEAGGSGRYSVVEFDCALWELEAFGFTAMQYTFTGVPEGFVPAEVSVYGKVVHEEAPYTVKALPQEHFEVSEEDGKWFVTATVPQALCGSMRPDGLTSCEGLIWYARDPEDKSMLSCGSVDKNWMDQGQIGQWVKFKPVEITGVPEGVTPEILVFFIDAK